ncbi:transposase IS111A/IS1328/IS1533 [Burkholderia sp. BT03]|nr:transposase IS111A/IS1328/IS1533 [Burkholderia sp. BT03]SKC49027.1 Transposase [Paraburkholderia hospita]
MALPFINQCGAGDGDAQARRQSRSVSECGASSHWVAVPRSAAKEPVREFGTMTDVLHALADWLLACGVDTVALESTGVYWIPVYEVLERRGLTVWLVDARQMKYVPGRKSDVQDCQWLRKLMSLAGC